MAKIHIFYKESDNNFLNKGNLRMLIDESNKYEVSLRNEIVIEMEKGVHNFKMYIGDNNIYGNLGFVEKNINIVEDEEFYVYRTPLMLIKNLKGKFKKIDGSKYQKILTKSKFWGSKKGRIILVIIAVIVWLLATALSGE